MATIPSQSLQNIGGVMIIKSKIYILLILVILFNGCIKNPIKKNLLESKVIREYESTYGEKYWFIDGLNYPSWDSLPPGPYTGMIYSESLRKLDFPLGITISTNGKGDSFSSSFNYVMAAYDFNKMVEPKLREIFGNKANIDTSGMKSGMWEEILRKRKLGYNDTGTYGHIYTQIIEVFVEDLDTINEEEYKEKTFEFASYLYNEWNVKAYLQIFVRDESFFEDYKLVKESIFPDFLRKNEVKEILKKIKRGTEISEEEKQILIDNFWKNLPNKGYVQRFGLNVTRDTLEFTNVGNSVKFVM